MYLAISSLLDVLPQNSSHPTLPTCSDAVVTCQHYSAAWHGRRPFYNEYCKNEQVQSSLTDEKIIYLATYPCVRLVLLKPLHSSPTQPVTIAFTTLRSLRQKNANLLRSEPLWTHLMQDKVWTRLPQLPQNAPEPAYCSSWPCLS